MDVNMTVTLRLINSSSEYLIAAPKSKQITEAIQ